MSLRPKCRTVPASAITPFTEDALTLVVRAGEGILRHTRNLCLSAFIEAVRDQCRTVDLPHVNAVLKQPHWRKEHDQKPL